MKCFNCLSRFVRNTKILSEDNPEEEVMATWSDVEMYGYSLKDLGLKTCPFDAKHKIKASNYSKHVMKCEQRFPKTASLSRDSSSGLSSSRFSSVDSVLEIRTDVSDVNDLTKSMNQLNTSDNWFITEETQIPVPSTSSSTDRTNSPDSAIGMTNSLNSSEDITEVHVSDNSPQIVSNSGQTEQQTERSTESRSFESQVVPIIPEQVTAVPEPTNETIDRTKGDDGSGDRDNDWNSGKAYSLYEGFDNFDDMTDDQIMEMANSFIDVVVLAKMSKTQRKQLNDKLIQLKISEKDMKKKAFNELVTFKDVWDPQLNDIPQEIRRPRIDVKELFNLNKQQNKRIDTLKSTTPVSPEPKECPSNPWSDGISPDGHSPSNLSVKSAQPSESCCSKSAAKHELNTICNSCWDPLAINELNIKRITVFCAKCSGIKFGGYFECHSCNLYGYFANSQISQHLSKHFPH